MNSRTLVALIMLLALLSGCVSKAPATSPPTQYAPVTSETPLSPTTEPTTPVTTTAPIDQTPSSPSTPSPPTAPTSASPTEIPASEIGFQKGVIYRNEFMDGRFGPDQYGSAASDATIAKLIKPTGANWVQINIYWYQDTPSSTRIHRDATGVGRPGDPLRRTESDASLSHIIDYAHSLGLKVMLKPNVKLSDPRNNRGQIDFGENEAAWKAWFDSYADFIIHYAALAKQTKADYFVVGNEFAKVALHVDAWRNIIRSVRQIYGGPLTYGAGWETISGGEPSVTWWDSLVWCI